MEKNKKVKKLTFISICATVAILLSYVEVLLPPIFAAVPGIKIGLPNIAIIFVLYRFGIGEAVAVSFVRIVIISMLFGNPMVFAYSVAGAFLSLLIMTLLKKLDFFSKVGVSVAGGVSHNIGQILMAMLLLETAEIGYYMIVLTFTGIISGSLIGLCAAYLLKCLPMKKI
ncbi:MAG: Gx transporter family protein [Clostridia bacterium]|nr:Gx transporter family protein [Clostridia bacterium]